MDKKEIFADGLGQIHYVGNMVRVDLVTLQPTAGGSAPVAESKERVIMPLQGFLGALDAMQKVADKLVATGVVKKNDKARK